MIINKKILTIIIAVVIIFIAGYININMSIKDTINTDNYIKEEEANMSNNANVTLSNEEELNFDIFKINKEKNDLKIIDYLEGYVANGDLSNETKQKFENLLIEKNDFLAIEASIEMILASKGYEEISVIVNTNNVKVITNEELENNDTMKILDVVMNETNCNPSQINIIKFCNIEL